MGSTAEGSLWDLPKYQKLFLFHLKKLMKWQDYLYFMDEKTESWQDLTTENQKKKKEKKEKSMSRWSSLWHEEGEGKTLQEIRALHYRTMFSPLPHPSDASSQARSTERAFWGRADRLRYRKSIAVEIQWPPFPKSCRCVWKAWAHLHAGLVEVHVVQLLLAEHQLHL